jgi:hypothetical protein
MDDDIEILDIFDKKKETVPSTRVSRLEQQEKKEKNFDNKPDDNKKTVKKTKKVVKKNKLIQLIFCVVSALFILGCVVFYGLRFIKYYRIYNPKVDSGDGSVLLAKDIVGKTEFGTDDEDGLFSSGGNYIYKGDVKNNYLKYNNMLWRIVRINSDNSIDIILDDYITLLPWNSTVTSFTDSEIYKYLNNDFLNKLDKDLLNKTSFCTDKLSSLTSITCDNQNSDGYVKLLDVANYLNSVNKGKSYLTTSDEIFWLADYGTDKIWHTNGSNVSQSLVNSFYEIRPMVRLKNTTIYSSGDGTKEKPFVVDKDNKITIGSRVKLGEDNWIVYDTKDNVRLMRETTLEKQIDFDKEKLSYKESSLMTYLNDTYLNSLSYKDMIIENTYDIGEYKDSIYDVKKDTVKTKVGIPNILDIKFDSKVKSYFTSTVNEERVLVYENPLRPGKVTTYRSMRPCITISKDTVNKLKYVDGIFKVGE